MLRSSRRPVPLAALILALACSVLRVTCSRFGPPTEDYALRDGESTGSPKMVFSIPPDLVSSSHDYDPVVEPLSSDQSIVKVLSTSFSLEGDDVIVSSEITMNRFPGRAQLRYTITLPNRTQNTSIHTVHVIGIVLYDRKRNFFYTGKNARSLPLRTDTVTTVNAKVFNAPSHFSQDGLPLKTIRMSVANSRYSHLLPWDESLCRVFAAASELNDNCSMAFSEDFTKFSFRVPTRPRFMTPLSLNNPVKILFRWPEVADLPSSNTNAEPVERNTVLTTALVRYPKIRPPISSLPGWKIALIIITSILAFVTVFIFTCCCLCAAKHGSPERSAMFSRKLWALGIRRGADGGVLVEKRASGLSQGEDILGRQEALSRSVYSQDTLGPISGVEAGVGDDALIPDEQMLAALMKRDGQHGEGDLERGELEGASKQLEGEGETGGGREHVDGEGSVDDALELQLELMRSRRRGGGGSGQTRGTSRGRGAVSRERMAFGAACERMKVVNMLIGPVSRGLISASNARTEEDDEEEGGGAASEGDEDDEVLQFSSEEFDMDVFDEARAAGGAGGAGGGRTQTR